jgi:hypothetical protein
MTRPDSNRLRGSLGAVLALFKEFPMPFDRSFEPHVLIKPLRNGLMQII